MKVMFVAEDGAHFENEEECISYENELFSKEIRSFGKNLQLFDENKQEIRLSDYSEMSYDEVDEIEYLYLGSIETVKFWNKNIASIFDGDETYGERYSKIEKPGFYHLLFTSIELVEDRISLLATKLAELQTFKARVEGKELFM